MTEHQIPQTLDAPPLALIFDAYQFLSFIIGAMIGVIIGKIFIFTVIGLIVGIFITKYDDKMPRGFIRHMGYFHGVPCLAGRRIPNGLERMFRA